MKLGISINCFDGEEFLKPQLSNLRSEVDHISVVYQLTSNFNQPANTFLLPLLESLKEEGLIDDLVLYNPIVFNNGTGNELKKRNVGLGLARSKGMTHLLSLDCDEFYDIDKFKKAKELIESNDYDVTYCHIQDYYRSPFLVHPNLAPYFVTFIIKIVNGVDFFGGCDTPYMVDPTRKVYGQKIFKFHADDLVMDHMTLVRATKENLIRKFTNSSARDVFPNPEGIADYHWSFNYNKDNGRNGYPKLNIKLDEYGINVYFREYISKYIKIEENKMVSKTEEELNLMSDDELLEYSIALRKGLIQDVIDKQNVLRSSGNESINAEGNLTVTSQQKEV